MLHRGVDAETGYTIINDENEEKPTARLDIVGDLRVRDKLGVEGKLWANNDLEVKGKFQTQKDASIDGNLHVKGTVQTDGGFEIKNTLNIDGELQVEKDLNVKRHIRGKRLFVDEAYISGTDWTSTGINIRNNLTVEKDLRVTGKIKATNLRDEEKVMKSSDLRKHLSPLVVDGDGNVFGVWDINKKDTYIDTSDNDSKYITIPMTLTGGKTISTKQTLTIRDIFQGRSMYDLKNIKLVLTYSNAEHDSVIFNHIGKKIFGFTRSWDGPEVNYSKGDSFIEGKSIKISFDYSGPADNVGLIIHNKYKSNLYAKYFITFF